MHGKKEKIALYACFAVWAILNFLLCLTHNEFRDEAQSWSVTKYNDIIGIIRFAWQEGHPWLYNLIIYPFAHLGLPYECVKFVSYGITLIAGWLYIKKSPFAPYLTCISLFVPPLLYYSAAFARNYTLLVFFAIAVGACWNKREQHPVMPAVCIGLFGSTHAEAWIPCIIMAVIFFGEMVMKEYSRRAIAASAVGFIIPIAIFDGPLVPQFTATFAKLGLPGGGFYIPIALGIAMFVLLLSFARKAKVRAFFADCKNRKVFFTVIMFAVPILSCVFCGIMAMSTPTALMTFIKVSMTVILFISFAWIRRCYIGDVIQAESIAVVNVAAVVLGIGLATYAGLMGETWISIGQLVMDGDYVYSCATETAEYINKEQCGETLIAVEVPGLVAVAAHEPDANIIDPYTNEKITYTHWFDTWRKIDSDGFISRIREYMDKDGYALVIMSCLDPDFDGAEEFLHAVIEDTQSENPHVELVYRSQSTSVSAGEEYMLFRFDDDDLDFVLERMQQN